MKKEAQTTPNPRLKAHRLKKNWTQVYVATMIGTNDVEVSRWENGSAVPTLYFREQLCALFERTPEELGFISEGETRQEANEQAASFWNIPYRRNPFFTGREEVLTRVTKLLNSRNIAAVTQIGAISGLGGIGKTQVAVEYAYRHRDEYQAVFWVKADTQENLLSDIAALVHLLNLPQKSEQDQGKIIQAVKRWLQTHRTWLLILDNVEDLTLVSEWLSTETGQILLTTRSQFTGTLAQCIDLERMAAEEGTLFLLHRSKLLALDATLEEVPAALRSSAMTIVEQLDGLPLALDQAGAYIEETGCSLSDYLQRYQLQQAALLARRGRMGTGHPHSVMTTLTMACIRVEQTNPAALALLRLCAFLHADAIPEEIMTIGASHLGPVLEPMVADPCQLDEAIAALRAYSLIRRDPHNKTLSMHRLVQAVLKERMDEAEQQEWIKRGIQVVNQVFPTDMSVELWNEGHWQCCEQLLPHALACATQSERWDFTVPDIASLLRKAATYLYNRGQYAEVEPLFRRILHIREQVLGEEHPNVASSLHSLANLYREQGKYAEAESLYLRVLHIWEHSLGPEHPLVALILNNLGVLYADQGKDTEAEPLYLRALRIREQDLELKHLDVALYYFAFLHEEEQGKDAEAESLFQHSLRIRKQGLGPAHPLVACPLHNLAELYCRQGRYDEAESLFQHSLSVREQVLGQEHPSLAWSLNGLAEFYRRQGKYEEAKPLYQEALRIREQALGAEHPLVAWPLNGLAILYSDQGKYSEAESLYLRSLHIWEQALGPEHPDIAYLLKNLAELYREQGEDTEAESLYLRTLHIREQCLGPLHPETAESLYDLAELYHIQGNATAAKLLYQRAFSIREQQLGVQHPETVETLERYTALLRETHREDEATAINARVLHARP